MNTQDSQQIKKSDEDLAKLLSIETNLPLKIANLLFKRGVKDKTSAHNFFNPSLEHLKPPFNAVPFKLASELIIEAREKKEKVFIYGDYDVDGTLSTVIIFDFLKNLGMDVSYYLPDRFSEGYGINMNAVNSIISKGSDLLITVDCGITNFDEISYAKKNGMKVIVTDHHMMPEVLPPADVILHSGIEECCFEYKAFAGVGIAYYFLIILRRILIERNIVSQKEAKVKFNLMKYLDLVALATVADVVPLNGENRTLVKSGLSVLSNTSSRGLYYLKELSGVGEKVSSFDIGFKLAPRINAAGRMGSASRIVELFTHENDSRVLDLAREIHAENNKRKNVQDEIMDEIIIQIENSPENYSKSIVMFSHLWHEGVIGICASKLADRYNVPVILLTHSEKKAQGEHLLKGSGRSIPPLDLYETLKDINDESKFLEKFGGHKMAAGLSLKKSNFEDFKRCFNQYVSKKIEGKDYIFKREADMLLNFSEIDMSFVELLLKFEPFGEANPKPLFKTEGLRVKDFKILKDKHWKGVFIDPVVNLEFEAIAFNMADRFNGKKSDLSIIYTIDINEFNNKRNLQLTIIDVF